MNPIKPDTVKSLEEIFLKEQCTEARKIMFDLHGFDFSYDFAEEFVDFYDEFIYIYNGLFVDLYTNCQLKTIFLSGDYLVLKYADYEMKWDHESYGIKDKSYIMEYEVPLKYVTQILIDGILSLKVKKYEKIVRKILKS